MSKCRICGRPLSNAASVAAGVGPICGSRGYQSRIRLRHGSGLGGWSEIEEWEKVNSPCYSCRYFEFPGKDDEHKTVKGFKVTMHGKEKAFNKLAIGGHCRRLYVLVDGNLVSRESECNGAYYSARKKEDEQPKVGLLYHNNQTELFEL